MAWSERVAKSSLDIKWRNQSLRGRSFAHATPRYVYHRVRHALYRYRHPELPDLSEQSIDLLSKLLRPSDVGAEWGAGNSTGWFAKRTKHITSFESGPDYVRVVKANLEAQKISNVDLRYIEFSYGPTEEAMHQSKWVRSGSDFEDNSLDYALVDSAPRACFCNLMTTKIRPGGLLILDNANWYLPPPATLSPPPVSSVEAAIGLPGSREPGNRCFPEFLERTKDWRHVWTSNGITATLIMVRT